MKKLLYYVLLFIIILLVPIVKVKAYTRLRTDNQSPIVGTQITLNLELFYGADAEIASAYYEIHYDTSQFEYDSIRWNQSTEQVDISSPGVIKIRKNDNGEYWERGDVAVIIMNVIAPGKSTISIIAPERAYYKSGNPVEQTLTPITFYIKEPNTNSRIGSLFVEGYTLNPTFNSNVHEYTLKVPSDVESVNVVAKPANKTQTITGDGTRKLLYGDNLVKVVVTAQDGTTETYRIMINREDNRSTDTDLSMLNVTNTEIRYEEGKYEYEAEVPKSVEKIVISARGKDPKSTITGMGEKQLEFGKNVFEIEIETASGQKQKYKFTITRSTIEFQSSNVGTKLQSLTIDGNKIDLQEKNDFSYFNKTGASELEIEAITRSVTAKAVITGNSHLKEGPNTITITVIEKTGEREDFKIHVYNFINPAQEINSFDINFDPINENRFYLAPKDQEVEIPQTLINSVKKNDYVFSLGYIDGTELPYLIKINKKIPVNELTASIQKLENKALPTYNINVPKDQEVSIYVGDLFPDGQIIRVYTYQEEDKIRELSPGTQITGGYITFTTGDNQYYVLTAEQLIQVETTIQDYIEQYKEIIAYSLGGILALVVVLKFVQYIKIRSKRKL